MSSSRFAALSYLAYRALLAHPAKRLGQRGSALERFWGNYVREGLAPTRPEDRAISEEASACILCGLCEATCELAGAAVASLGLPAVFRLCSKSSAELPYARELLSACVGCGQCRGICPTGVPIPRIVHYLQERASGLGSGQAPPQ
ncbi:MAG TPA: (Fe-S)-binding protein [Anaeromyxobacteraceae bacterium]|nr:(Fe-S)-binding protein [Anaeromyxobacteraceae bacterium]